MSHQPNGVDKTDSPAVDVQQEHGAVEPVSTDEGSTHVDA
jgi:hypothetical protein